MAVTSIQQLKDLIITGNCRVVYIGKIEVPLSGIRIPKHLTDKQKEIFAEKQAKELFNLANS